MTIILLSNVICWVSCPELGWLLSRVVVMCYHVLLCVIMFLLQSLQTVCRQCLHRSSICYVSECGLGFCYLHYLIELTNFIHSFTHSLIERTSIVLLEDGLLRGASGSTPAMQTVFRYLLKVYAECLANQKEGYSKWSAQPLKWKWNNKSSPRDEEWRFLWQPSLKWGNKTPTSRWGAP